MITKEINRFGIQSNAVGITVEDDTVNVLLSNGTTMLLKCSNSREANEVKNTILYYKPTEDSSGHEFDFSVLIFFK